jgi:flagella basal body P-ring formation protein FlgA
MVAQAPGMTITTTGRALEGGAIGDVIQVMNLQSKKTIQATVTGSSMVQVVTAPRLIASN